MNTSYRVPRLLAACALLVPLVKPSLAHPEEKLEKIRIGYPTITPSVGPWWIAKDAGIFLEEGLDVEMTFISGGAIVVQAVLGGDIQAGYAGTPPIVSAIARGAGLSIVAVNQNRLDYVLVSREVFNDPRRLTGKKFAISSRGAISEFATRIALKKLGVNPDSVVMFVVGGSPLRIAALQRGSVDASILSTTEFFQVQDMGFHPLFEFLKSDVEYPFNVICVTKRFAKEKKHVVSGIIRGLQRGLWFMRNNPDRSLHIMARWLRTPVTDELRRQWKYVAFDLFEEIPYPTEAGFSLLINQMAERDPAIARLRMGDLVDTSFLDELSGAGFFKQVKSNR